MNEDDKLQEKMEEERRKALTWNGMKHLFEGLSEKQASDLIQWQNLTLTACFDRNLQFNTETKLWRYLNDQEQEKMDSDFEKHLEEIILRYGDALRQIGDD